MKELKGYICDYCRKLTYGKCPVCKGKKTGKPVFNQKSFDKYVRIKR